MPVRWYQSFYWRVAGAFLLCLVTMLVVQAVLFVWVISRGGPALPGQPPDRFAQTVARDLADALERDATLDLSAFVAEQFGRDAHPFFVVMADGRAVSNAGPVPEALLRAARGALRRWPGLDPPLGSPDGRRGPPPDDAEAFGRGARPEGRVPGPPGDEGRGFLDRPPRGPRGDPFRPSRPVPVVVRGQLAAVVIVPPVAPFRFLLRRYAPTLSVVAGGALVAGALLAAVVVFGPTRRRLRAVELAARRLGAGDLTARVPADGGDEVAAVAAAFNAMAGDLAARAEALAAADRSRRQLLADVSHELTTPVTAVRGYLETLAMPELGLDDATRARYLGIIGDETERLERIIGDLLELARLEGGGSALAPDDVDVEPLFARVLARHDRSARNAGVHFATAVPLDATRIRADRDRIEQALQNLAANALRYAPSGSTIELRATRAADGTVTLTTTDDGPGIPPEHLPHVFDRFYKVDASRAARSDAERQDGGSTAPGGSGLGLSIVKAIVERHGGRVSVASRPGRTVFTIAGLPGADAEAAD